MLGALGDDDAGKYLRRVADDAGVVEVLNDVIDQDLEQVEGLTVRTGRVHIDCDIEGSTRKQRGELADRVRCAFR